MTVAGELYLGLDFGTLSVRALVTDARGEVVAGAAAPYAGGEIVRGTGGSLRLAQPLPAGWALQDPDDWLASGRRRARRRRGRPRRPGLHRRPGPRLHELHRAAHAGRRHAARRTDLATRPHAWPKLWKHHGAQRQASELTAVARERSEPWLDRYGGVVGLEWSFPKLLEVLDEDPAITEATEVWMEGGDWVVWQLTGAPSSGGDRTPAGLVRSTCQAGYKALWSPASGYPGAAYLDAVRPGFGHLAERVLGGCFRAPGEAAGELSAAGAAALGLRAGVPVSAAVIDARGRARRRRERDRHSRPGPRHQRVPHGHGRRGAPDPGGGRCRRGRHPPGVVRLRDRAGGRGRRLRVGPAPDEPTTTVAWKPPPARFRPGPTACA